MASTLTLESLNEIPSVTIDKVEYPLKVRALRSIVDTVKLELKRRRIAELFECFVGDKVTVDEAAELSALLNETCRMVLDAPDEIHQALNDDQRFDIVHTFLTLQSPILRTSGAKPEREPTPTPTPTIEATTDPIPIGSSVPVPSRDSTEVVLGIG